MRRKTTKHTKRRVANGLSRRVNPRRQKPRAACALLLPVLLVLAACDRPPAADPENADQVAQGKAVYAAHCASCHGANLEGQPNWRERLATGRFPAPPHDETGHTWHHSDRVLFDITKNGVEPYAPPAHQSDMPAFGGRLSDEEIWAVLAYIKSTWPEETRRIQAEISAKDAKAKR